jgi:hypothetical protein
MTGVAVLVDVASWIGLSARLRTDAEAAYDSTARVLLGGGWRVLEVRHGSTLPRLWPHAATRGGGGNATLTRVGMR